MQEDRIEIKLPIGPSVNELFAGKVRRHKSDKYEKWIVDADIVFDKLEDDYRIIGDNWLIVELNYYFSLYTKKGEKRIKDTANYEKAVIDYLASKIEGFQDHKVKRIIQEKHDSLENIVKITIKEL